MVVKIQTKKLPFEEDMSLPQRLRFEHRNELYKITYRRNSFDGSIYIKIELVKAGETLLTTRLVEGGLHTVVKDEDKGLPSFSIYVGEIAEDLIDVKLIDEDTRFILDE